MSIAPELLVLQPQLAESTQFFFPEAPLSLAEAGMPGGRAWWMLDVERLNALLASGGLRDLRNDQPPELPAAREQLTTLIDQIRQETGLPMSRIVMGGFSQGSMLSVDVALRLPEPPALLAVFSGSLMSENFWRELASKRGPLQVLQSHGRQDMILPFQGGEWLRDLFEESGFDVEFIEFDGPHTIPPQALTRFAELLGELAAE